MNFFICPKHGTECEFNHCSDCETERVMASGQAFWRGVAMVVIWTLLIIVVGLIGSSCQAVEINDRFLNALSWVESRNVDSAIGKRGEIGRFQFSRAAWLQVSEEPYASATEEHVARLTARKYCLWLQSQLRRKLKREPSPAEIYCAYNLGPSGFERRGNKIKNCPKTTRRNAKLLESKI